MAADNPLRANHWTPPPAKPGRRRSDTSRSRRPAGVVGGYSDRMTKPSLLLISGSVRATSTNASVLNTVASLAGDRFEPIVFTALAGLPFFNPDNDHDPLPPAIRDLRTAIDNASALLFSTPEYAGAMPGALKNLLEWTVGGVEIAGKPTGWINPSTTVQRAAGTYESLRVVLEYTDARLVPAACLDVPVPRALIGEDGIIRDAGTRARLDAVIAALAQTIGS